MDRPGGSSLGIYTLQHISHIQIHDLVSTILRGCVVCNNRHIIKHICKAYQPIAFAYVLISYCTFVRQHRAFALVAVTNSPLSSLAALVISRHQTTSDHPELPLFHHHHKKSKQQQQQHIAWLAQSKKICVSVKSTVAIITTRTTTSLKQPIHLQQQHTVSKVTTTTAFSKTPTAAVAAAQQHKQTSLLSFQTRRHSFSITVTTTKLQQPLTLQITKAVGLTIV